MPFQRFVETGRIAVVAHGSLKGKLIAIVDVIDQNRVLIDGPETGVTRQEYRLNNLHLTKFRLKFPFHAPTRVVRKAWIQANLKEKWEQTTWYKKEQATKKRYELNDFDRFKIRVAKSTRNKIIGAAYKKLRSYANRDGTLYGPKSIVVKTPGKKVKKPKAAGAAAPKTKKETPAKAAAPAKA